MTFLKGLDFPRSMGHNHTGMLGGFGPEPTLDQVLGRSSKFYGGETPGMGSLLLSAGYGGSFSADVIGGRYTTLPAYDNLDAAYARAFFAAAPGERQRHRRIIDRVVEQYTRLRANPRLSRADGQALDAHVTLMAQLEDRLTKQRALTCDAVPPGPVRGAANTDNALDLTVAALSCGVTQVVCINLYYAPMATPNDWHGDSHTPEAGGKTVQRLLDINRWVAENAFLKLLRKMDAVVEPNGGTLLDNSIVMWGNELSAGNGHTNDDQPVVLAGSAGGWLRTGVMLDYTQYDRPPVPADNAGSTRRVGRLYNQLLSTIMLAMGLDRSDFEKPGRPGFGDPLSQSLDRNARYDATRAEAGDPLPRINAKP
jgi:hypothetical protein